MFQKEVKKHIAHNEYKRAIYDTIIQYIIQLFQRTYLGN